MMTVEIGKYQQRLQEMWPEIVQEWSQEIKMILAILKREGVITGEDQSQIDRSDLGTTGKMRELLVVLNGRGEDTCKDFLSLLEHIGNAQTMGGYILGQNWPHLENSVWTWSSDGYANRDGHLVNFHQVQSENMSLTLQHQLSSRQASTFSIMLHSEELLLDCIEKHKHILSNQYRKTADYFTRNPNGEDLERRCTNVTIKLIEGYTEQSQHEVTEVGNSFKILDPESSQNLCELEKMCQDLLHYNRDVSLLCGVAGSGKTTVTMKLVWDWVKKPRSWTSKIIFVFTFRELNLISDCKSLKDLLSSHYSHLKPVLGQLLSADPSRMLVILDGLDEFKYPLDFANTPKCTDPDLPQSIGSLVVNLIKGNILLGLPILVTARPHAVSRIPQEYVRSFYKILGFSSSQQKEYFHKSCQNPEIADELYEFISSQRPLSLMCHIPAFCWITVTALQEEISSRKACEAIATVTEVYCRFLKAIIVFHGDGREGSHVQSLLKATESLKTVKKHLKDLGFLAFKGLVEQKFIFDQQDIAHFQVDQSSLSQMFLVEILKEDKDSLTCEKNYHFVHTSLQEFFAALYYVMESRMGGDPFSCIKGNHLSKFYRTICRVFSVLGTFRKQIKLMLRCHHNSQSGNLDLFCRFLTGLLAPRTYRILEGIFSTSQKSSEKDLQHLIRFLHKQLCPTYILPERQINICYCLYEAQDPGIREKVSQFVMHATESSNSQTYSCKDWTELAFVLQLTNSLEELNLENKGLDPEAVKRLCPILPFFKTLRLAQNPFGAEGATVLSQVLMSPDCKVENLWIVATRLGSEGLQELCVGLKQNRSVKDLRMAINNICDEGAAALAEVLKTNDTLLDVRLRDNMITDNGANLLMSALKENSTLEKLWLFDNKLSKEGVKALKDFAKTREKLDIKACT
ncbi:protein NLRC3-like [Erpetoichthys calabaricus]|uniref:Si:dkey-118k5.3 n=1 Tax=Erpetoichthys calabaricus TaxID=27687 RepID=A0A8C4S431_ERPCA|nr:protein NLRC3-like [Erpetoichthys calabaricus]